MFNYAVAPLSFERSRIRYLLVIRSLTWDKFFDLAICGPFRFIVIHFISLHFKISAKLE